MGDIYKAAFENDVRSLAESLARGADLNRPHARAGTLPLQLACQGNALDSIRFLLANGADSRLRFTRISRVDGRVFRNHTPLLYAKSVEAARLLLDAGADIDAEDECGNSSLVWAILEGNVELVRFYLSQGATIPAEIEHLGERISLEGFIDARIAHFQSQGGQTAVEEVELLRAVHREVLCAASAAGKGDQ